MTDLWRLPAADLAPLIKSKQVSARDAATAALARLDQVNHQINAVIDHRPEDVLQQADAIDARLARGEDPGPLAGVPVTIKVNVDQTGYATTNGLKAQRDLERIQIEAKQRIATAEAIQCVEATTPKVPVISGRVVKLAMLSFSLSIRAGRARRAARRPRC